MITGAGAGASGASIDAEGKRVAAIGVIAELRHAHLIVMRAAAGGGFEPELAGGRVLSELQVEGSPPLRVTLRILLDAMSGLATLHRVRAAGRPLDFVHGEVMPANIVVGRDGIARLVPLVAAHWSTSSPPALEAVGYAAPEKLLGDGFGQRADIFSVGVLLWEAMMQRPLFRNVSVDDIVTQLVGGKIARPYVADAPWSAKLADVVMRALAVDPTDRWEHVGAMASHIETIAEGELAKSSEVAALVTGRSVSSDFLSEAVTRPRWSASLTPLANSIPASTDEPTAPDSLGALSARPADSAEPASSVAVRATRLPMTKRRRWAVVGWALAFGALVLAIVGLTKVARKTVPTVTTSVSAPAAAPPAQLSGALPSEAPLVASPPIPSSGQAPSLVKPRGAAQEAKSIRPATSPSSRDRAKPSASVATPKTKEDPFGLSKPVRQKAMEDPFGL